MPSKCVLLLLDGLADHAHPGLGHRTPLEAASTPGLDRLVAGGACGLYHPTSVGEALPSEIAHLPLLGYDTGCFPGRGALEALGAGVDLGPHDVALLAHLACLQVRGDAAVLVRDRPRLPEDEAAALTSAVAEHEAEGIRVRFHPTGGAWGVLVLSGGASPFVTDTSPMIEGRPLADVRPWAEHARDPATRRTARALRAYLRWSHRVLSAHPVNRARARAGLPPANGWVTQRPGRLKPVAGFTERFGMRGLTIASGAVYHGLGRFLGLDVERVRDSGDPARDLEHRLRLARDALADHDFVHVHTKAPDEAGHRKDPGRKARVIEALDRAVGRAVGPLAEDPEVLLVVTADHATPSSGPLIHSGETVPVLLHGPGVRRDGVRTFDEVSAAGGCLGLLRGTELFGLVLTHTGRARLAGTREAPDAADHWPAPYEPLRLDEEGR